MSIYVYMYMYTHMYEDGIGTIYYGSVDDLSSKCNVLATFLRPLGTF